MSRKIGNASRRCYFFRLKRYLECIKCLGVGGPCTYTVFVDECVWGEQHNGSVERESVKHFPSTS